jgi:hypothetical protein
MLEDDIAPEYILNGNNSRLMGRCERVGTKAPPKSVPQVRSIVDKIKGRVRRPTDKAKPEWFE